MAVVNTGMRRVYAGKPAASARRHIARHHGGTHGGRTRPRQRHSDSHRRPVQRHLHRAHEYASLATRLSEDIAAAIRGRSGYIAIRAEDVRTGVECRYNEGNHSHSASVVKATILAALLYWRQQTHTSLSSTEKYEATLMIEYSDNNAATYLWNESATPG